MNGTSFILINKWLTRDHVLCKFFTIFFFEIYVSLTNMYCLLCIMQSHKMTKLDKIISDLGPEERKCLMEKLQ